MTDIADTRQYRRETKKRGPYGTDWANYRDGVPPEDDLNDYEWKNSHWYPIHYEDD